MTESKSNSCKVVFGMSGIEKITNQNTEFVEYLLRDPVDNGFAVEDARDLPKDAQIFVSRNGKNNEISGYILNHYEGREAFVYLKASASEEVSSLLNLLPQDRSVTIYLTADPKYLQIIRDYLSSKQWNFDENREDLMAVKRNMANLASPNSATIIPKKYVRDVALLITDTETEEAIKVNSLALDQKKIWGLIVEDHVVSIAGIASRQPEIGMIVNVVTHPNFRRRGFGTMVTSAATKSVLQDSAVVSLYVDATNLEAKRLYEKLGYRVFEESVRFKVKPK